MFGFAAVAFFIVGAGFWLFSTNSKLQMGVVISAIVLSSILFTVHMMLASNESEKRLDALRVTAHECVDQGGQLQAVSRLFGAATVCMMPDGNILPFKRAGTSSVEG